MNSGFINQITSFAAIVIGGIIIFMSIGDLLFKVMVALVGLWIVNYGLRLRGVSATRMFTARFFGGGPFNQFYK